MNKASVTKSDRHKKSKLISNKKERKRIYFSILLACVLIILTYLIRPDILEIFQLHTMAFIAFHQYIGSTARVGFFFAVAIYPLLLIMKSSKVKRWRNLKFPLKRIFQFLAKTARQWHVPVAITSAGIILIHAYFAILNGIKWNGGYISGFTALGLLATLMLSGLFRYKKRGRMWHLTLGLLFVTTFIIHTLFSPS